MDIIQNIVYIKIDCEGFDEVVLQSLIPMIDQLPLNKKPAIQIEYFEQDRIQADGDNGLLTDRMYAALNTLTRLSGNYSLYCTITCNTPLVLTECRKPPRGVALREKTLVSKISGQYISCLDVMAIPNHLAKKMVDIA